MSDATAQDMEESSGAISVERVLGAIRRRLHIVAIMVCLAAGVATALVVVLPTRYEAAAIVQIDPRKKNMTSLDNVVSELRADTYTVDSEVEVIRSRAITLKVIEKLGLRNDPEFTQASPVQSLINTILRRTPETGRIRRDAEAPNQPAEPMTRIRGTDVPGMTLPAQDEIAAAFAGKLRVSRIRNTLLIEIRFSSADAIKAAQVANAVAEFYLADQLEAKRQAAGFASSVLEEKLETLRAKVAAAERKVAEFKAQHSIFDAEGHLLAEKQMSRLMEQTVLARNATAEARAKYEQAQLLAKVGAKTDDIDPVLQSQAIQLLKTQLASAMRKEAELRTKYGERHPEILKVRAEVQEAKAQLDEEIKKLLTSLRNESETAERRENQMALALAAVKDQNVDTKAANIELAELQRDATTEKQLYEALLTRFKETAEIRDMQLPDARIVEQADVPLAPSAPKRVQIVFLALIFGLVSGAGLALVLEFATPGVAVPEDVERVLNISHLASMPAPGPNGSGEIDPVRAVRLILAEPDSAYAEAIRSIRREVDLRRPIGVAPRVIMVASALPGEGSDLIASNLAHHYALTGNRVLLVDGDLRRAPLTRRLTPDRPPGLAEALLNQTPVENAILRDSATGLHFLPASSNGTVPSSCPELLGSTRMMGVVGSLRRHYDTIVIEAPPLMPVIDGRILADHADLIIFALTWRRTPKQLAKKALKSLGLNQQKVAGAVICHVDPGVLMSAPIMQPVRHSRRPHIVRAA